MEVLWIDYDGSSRKYILFIVVGKKEGKKCGLDVYKMSDHDKELFRKNSALLSSLSLDKMIAWIGKNCQFSYRNAYRELHVSKMRVINKYSI